MKMTKWIALLLMGAMLTSCDVGQPIPRPSDDTTTQTTEKTTLPSTTTAVTTTNQTLFNFCDCGALRAHVIGENLDKMLTGKTNLTEAELIDRDSLRLVCDAFSVNEGEEGLLDGTDAEWVCVRDSKLSEKYEDYWVWIFFSTTEAVTVSAYVLTTGHGTNEALQSEPDGYYPNPVEWTLYATNDPEAFSAETPSEAGWTVLDYVYDGNIHDVNLMSHGLVIDDKKQAPYQYYALMLGYTSGSQISLSELELYMD